jgi:hypothetical protein
MTLSDFTSHNGIASKKDGNGYPRPVTWWVFPLLGSGSELNFVSAGLLVGQMLYPMGLRVRVWFS